MADPNLFHEPEAFDVIESMFGRILQLLDNINNKVGGGASKTSSGAAHPTSGPSHTPERQDKPGDILSDIFSSLGKHFGVETKAQALKRIDANQTRVEKDVNLEEIKARLYEARAGGDLGAESQAKKDLAAANARLQKTVEVVPDKANVDAGQMASGIGGFMKGLGRTLDRIGFSEGGKVPVSPQPFQPLGFASGGSTATGGQNPPSPADTIPAMLRPGEYVLTPEMVSKIGTPFLNKLKDGGSGPVGFAHGGPVGDQGLSAGQAISKGGQLATDVGKIMSNPADIKAWVDAIGTSIELFVDNIKAFGRHIKEMGQATDKFMMSDKFEDQAGAIVEGQEAAGKFLTRGMATAIGGPIGGAILGPVMEKMGENNPVIMFEKALIGTIATIRKWNDQLHESNMKFAQFSSSMAAVQARQQYRDIQLSIERGGRRAESAEHLAASRHELNERLSVFEDTFANFKNELMANVNHMVVGILDQTPILRDIIDALRAHLRPQENVSPNEAALMENFFLHHRQRTRERLR